MVRSSWAAPDSTMVEVTVPPAAGMLEVIEQPETTMKPTTARLAYAVIPLCFALPACAPVGGGGGGQANADASTADAAVLADEGVQQPPDMALPNYDECQFEVAKQGNAVGTHIGDFTLDQWDGTPFSFHENCGGGVRAIWVFLSTGWCGACEQYAPKAQNFFRTFEDDGLRIVWIVGEDAAGDAPTPEYMEDYFRRKDVTFTVLRDDFFAETQRFLDPNAAGSSLPRQFILDGRTMELLFADGGVGSGAESIVACTCTKPMTVEQCMNRGR